jgi:RND family efflux transporter MFP subunit
MRTGLLLCGLVALVGLGVGCKPKPKKKEKDPPISVEVGRVSQRDLREYVRFTGDLEGEASVNVFAPVADRIRSLRVDVGDVVKKGQVLAVIEHTRLRQAVAQAQAQLAMVRSQLAGAQVSLAGSRVAASSAKREYARLRRLLKSGAIGTQQVDLSKVQYQGSVTKVSAARAQVQALLSQIRALRASVAQARTVKANAVVRAPISGLVARRFRRTGDMNMPQMALVSIVRMDTVKVVIKLSGSELAKVHLGTRAQISVAGHPGRKFWGKVVKIAPTLDMDTRTAPADILIPNVYWPKAGRRTCKSDSDCQSIPGTHCYLSPKDVLDADKKKRRRNVKKYCVEKHPLKPGMIAKVRSLIKVHRKTMVIPTSAILNDSYGYSDKFAGQTLAVYALDANNKPVRRKIKVGIETENGDLQVLSGLKPSERILIRGQNLLRPKSTIKIVKEEGGSSSVTTPRAKPRTAPRSTN